MTEQEKKAKGFRDYRQSCGIVDPIMLDEIEEAYYEGMIKQKEILKANLIWHCNNITEEQYNLESNFIDSFIDEPDMDVEIRNNFTEFIHTFRISIL